ncbi:MAG: type I secretion system permease/ATPase [Desulfohalobiaceae bacterium]|nr:type I secretion system permease/ATPase [Desulfohalobiaceae bacterium]
MRHIVLKLLKYFFYAGLFSLVVNILYLVFPLYLLVLFEKVLDSYSFSSLLTVTVGTVFALAVMGLLHYIRSRILIRSGLEVDRDLKSTVLAEMFASGVSLNRAGYRQGLTDIDILRNYFGDGTLGALFDVFFVPLFVLAIFFLHPDLGVVALCGTLGLVLLWLLQHRLIRKRWDQAGAVLAIGQNLVASALRNLETVTAMGMDQGIEAQWQKGHQQGVDLQARVNGYLTGLGSLNIFLRLTLQTLVFGLGIYLVFQGDITAGIAVAALVLTGRCLFSLEQAMSTWKKSVEARSAFKRLDQLLKGAGQQESMDLPAPEGRLEVEGAGLALGGRNLLRNITFSLESGEFLGVIGPSGAGKTVLAKMILGIWPSLGGKVRLDGADVFLWDHRKLGPSIGYLPQEVSLFSGSVSQNIARLGEISADQVLAAAQKAGLHETILRLPQGYDTEIGEAGARLAAGQRRLLGLARAVYNRPGLVVLDEPNADLDDAGEQALVNCLGMLKDEGVTVIMVTHKPVLLNSADKVLMLKDGQTVTFGPRQEVFQRLMGQKQQRG